MLAVASLLALTAACGPQDDGDDGGNGDAAPDGEGPEVVDVQGEAFGSEVTDESVTFTLHEMECGIESIGDREASGQFCVASITVRNDGDEEFELSAGNQRLETSGGRTANAEGSPAIRDALEGEVFEPIAPGESAEGEIAFDIDAEQTVDNVRLRATHFSGGALFEVE